MHERTVNAKSPLGVHVWPMALAAANEVDNSVVGGVEQQAVKNKSISSQSSSSDNRVSVHIETSVFPAGRWDHITQYFQLTFLIHFTFIS